MNIEPTTYEKLELLPVGSSLSSRQFSLSQAMRSLTQHLLQRLTNTQEPRIQSRLNQEGHLVFDAYDPVTHQNLRGLSELEVRTWLEKRYYIQPTLSQQHHRFR